MAVSLESLRRYARTPPRSLATKVRRRLSAAIRREVQRGRDRRLPSFLVQTPVRQLSSILRPLAPAVLQSDADGLAAVCEHYLAHRFDLLGSGWVRVHHGRRCRGVEGFRYDMGNPVQPDAKGAWLEGRINRGNVVEARRIWRLVSSDYVPVDWQLDFKSGFRWQEDTWYLDVEIPVSSPGADIKVPWELARCQHHPHLAFAWTLAEAGTPGLRASGEYAAEYRNEVLDFIASNPPRFGVNWKCTMDVAIRIANWLIAYDLFRVFGCRFDKEFEAVLARSAFEHGRHIVENLEWTEQHRSNHYLSDIVGLLFAAAYLPADVRTNAWAAFALRELINEVRKQFTEDGANIEGSTSYHRLSAELAVHGTALALALTRTRPATLDPPHYSFIPSAPRCSDPPAVARERSASEAAGPFPVWYIERLERMAEFTSDVSKPDHRVVQIGDNDSGRLFKLQPVWQVMTVAEARLRQENLVGYEELNGDDLYWDEDVLDHRHLVAATRALYDCPDSYSPAGSHSIDAALVASLSGGARFAGTRGGVRLSTSKTLRIGRTGKLHQLKACLESLPESNRCVYVFPLPLEGAGEVPDLCGYPDFGLYIFRTSSFFLAVRCGPAEQVGIGSHLHNDQLAAELIVGQYEVAADPGTYLYTPLPARRNEYRSVAAHFSPRIAGREPGDIGPYLFVLNDRSRARCVFFGPDGFAGTHCGFGDPVHRIIEIRDARITISDFSEGEPLEPCPFRDLTDRLPRFAGPAFSPKYGCRVRQ